MTAPASAYTPSPEWSAFRDYPGNPLIEPHWPAWIIADPTVLPPELTPDGRWHLFANGLRGIDHFTSADGFAWTQVDPEPIIGPEGSGWKRAFVYQLDVARSGRELRIYYNARSGWFLGAERIGVAIAST